MEYELVVFLRAVGAVSLCALIFVPFPYAWMNAIHRGLGMGVLPDAPVVLYLARSTSLFYALLGGLMWAVSFDVTRYQPIVVFFGASLVALGVALSVVDWAERMPRFWKIIEGPSDIAIGAIMVWLALRVG